MIERHTDKYGHPDSNLEQVDVLIGAYIKDSAIYPVRMEIKEIKGNGGRLYFAVTIEKSRIMEVVSLDNEPTTSTSISYSLAELIKNINQDSCCLQRRYKQCRDIA